MHYRRPKGKRFYNYLLPFFIIAVIFSGIFYGWKSLNRTFIDQNKNTINEKVFLSIESGSAKAMTVGKSEWQNAPDKIYLYRGERLKTGSDGRATLTFFEQSIMRINTDTEISFASLKKKNDVNNIEVELEKGDIWAKVGRLYNPNSTFSITTDLLTIDTRGSVLAVSAPGTIYVMEGSTQIGIKHNDYVIKTYNVGVGQQFIADKATIESIAKGGAAEVIFAMSDTFKETNWYRWNIKKDGAINAFEESGLDDDTADGETSDADTVAGEAISSGADSEGIANIDRVVYITKPSKNSATNKSTITIEGNYDSSKIKAVYVDKQKAVLSGDKWSASVKLVTEGDNTINIEAEDMSGIKTALSPFVINYDKTAPAAPVVTEPLVSAPGEPVLIKSSEQLIAGTVSSDTEAVIVNDYRLAKYVPGSKEFKYYAKAEYGNLQAGENEFKIYAEDKAGNLSEVTIIIIELDKEAAENVKSATTADDEADDDKTASSLPQASANGGVKITSPNNGESFTTSETEFEITGDVPGSTAKVTVNDYPLSLFKPGDTTFKYRAFASIGNLKIGEKNNYIIKAYNAGGDILGEASITIDVQSGAVAAPVISIPVTSGSYLTTLDTIVIGGTVGKWVSHMYVNDKEVKDYIPGSEKWRTTVSLNPGENTFVVSGEKDGESVGKATIKITYQQ